MPPLTDIRREALCLAYFRLQGTPGALGQALCEAGYSSRITRAATALLARADVQARLAELNQLTLDASVAGPLERKQRLTEIVRARLTDYTHCGPDGDQINVGPESPNTGALQEITSRTEYDEDGSHPRVITKLRLRDPVPAISELNRMERIGQPDTVFNLNQDNRQIHIHVGDQETAALLNRVSERTGKLVVGEGT